MIGLPDPKWGEKVTAVVVARPGTSPTAEEILKPCRALIAGYKVPKAVHFADALPIGGTGKILKREVREEYRRRFPS